MRAPRLLYRSWIGDLTRVGFLTTFVLVTIIAFGATIKPLDRGDLVSVAKTAKYISLVCVPMLQFALPFAVGFAATMTYHRLVTDNEIVAAATSGLSYPRIILPVGVIGLLVTAMMLGLTQWAIPAMWTRIDRTITTDLTDMLEASIGRNEAFELGDLQIWADQMIREPEAPASGADLRLRLFNVAVADLDDGRIVTDVTAQQVVLDLYERPEATWLNLAMVDAVAYKPSDGMLAWMERPRATTLRLPRILDSSPRSMNLIQMLAAHADPDLFDNVLDKRRDLADAMRLTLATDAMDERLREGDPVVLVDENRRFEIRAARLQGGSFRAVTDGVVEIVEHEGDKAIRLYEVTDAVLSRRVSDPIQSMLTGLDVGRSEPDPKLFYDLLLLESKWTDLASGATNIRAEVNLERLTLDRYEGEEMLTLSSDELLARVASRRADRPALDRAAERLEDRIARMRLEVTGRLQKRCAMSFTGLLLMLIGATMAMVLRGSTPLVVYLWAFLPSVVDLILISSGEHMIRDGEVTGGTVVMWSGNMLLTGIFLIAMRRLGRN